MTDSVLRQVANLHKLSHGELLDLWKTLKGSDPPAYNRTYIISRLAYRIQEIAYGGLQEADHEQMGQILRDEGFDPARAESPERRRQRDTGRRKDGPVAGTKLVRYWNGKTYEVTAVHGGFEFEGRLFRSLSAIAKAITGAHWNGHEFFGTKKRGQTKK